MICACCLLTLRLSETLTVSAKHRCAASFCPFQAAFSRRCVFLLPHPGCTQQAVIADRALTDVERCSSVWNASNTARHWLPWLLPNGATTAGWQLEHAGEQAQALNVPHCPSRVLTCMQEQGQLGRYSSDRQAYSATAFEAGRQRCRQICITATASTRRHQCNMQQQADLSPLWRAPSSIRRSLQTALQTVQ